MTNRCRTVSLVIALLLICSTHLGAQNLPAQFSDKEFWKLVTDFSEPNGYYRYENFVSNEDDYQSFLPELARTFKPGSIYVGVGPEQNFTYISALKPKLAFVVDIRRQNMLELLLYKALFELSTNRADFVSRLFSRKATKTLTATSNPSELMEAFENTPGDQQLFDETLATAWDLLTKTHGFELSADDDKEGVTKVFKAFFDGGPKVDFFANKASTPQISYKQLMSFTDLHGHNWSYLASEENFRAVQEYEKKNLIIPLVGDFAGPKAVRAIGQYAKEHDTTIGAFYTSNVDEYLFQGKVQDKFLANVATLPLNPSSMIIRMNGGPSGALDGTFQVLPGKLWAGLLSPMPDLVKAFNAGQVKTRTDLNWLSRRSLLSATPGLAHTAFNGKWKTEAPGPNPQLMDQITMTFKITDSKVTGSIARTQPVGQTPVPIDGTVTLDTITFTVKSPDGARTIAFTGKLSGDEVVFTREAKGSGGGRGIFGLDGPQTLSAKRME